MRLSVAALAVAAFVAVASAAVVEPNHKDDNANSVGPVSPEHDPRTSLIESIHRMKLSIDRELVYLARMEEVAANRDTRGMVARQAGFTNRVNDGSDVFAPILPGSPSIPSGRQFAPADMTTEPEPEPDMTSDPTPPVTPVVPTVPVDAVPVPTEEVEPVPVPTELPTIAPTEAPSVVPLPTEVPTMETTPAPVVPTFVPEESVVPVVPVPTEEFIPTALPTPVVTEVPAVAVEPTPLDETPTPLVETPTPLVETPTPLVETPTPLVETLSPVVETPVPEVMTPEPTPTSLTATPTPIAESGDPTPTPLSEEDDDLATSPDTTDDEAESGSDATTPDDSDDSVCFPASASVTMADGSVKPMKAIALGDRVRVSATTTSSVFMFTHKMGNVRYPFVQLTTDSNNTLSLTSGHYLYVNGRLAAASTVQLGDELQLADLSSTRVVDVQQKVDVGLYNPQTVHGDLIVDGVRVSTYTTAVAPRAAHAFLMPLRAAFERVGFSLTAFESGADQLSKVVPKGSLVL